MIMELNYFGNSMLDMFPWLRISPGKLHIMQVRKDLIASIFLYKLKTKIMYKRITREIYMVWLHFILSQGKTW